MSTKTIVRTFTFNGKRYYVRGKTEREAIEKLTLKRKALEDNTVICEPSMTVRRWAEHWLNEYKEPVVSEGWYKELRSITVRFIIEPLGSLKMSAIRPIHLQGILNNLNSYSRHYAENIRAVLIELFRVAFLCYFTLEAHAAARERESTHALTHDLTAHPCAGPYPRDYSDRKSVV